MVDESLRSRLLSGVTIATPEEAAAYFADDDTRWGETLTEADSPTGDPIIYINDRKFKAEGAKNYRDKMIMLESLHRLKDVDGERYKRLLSAAESSPEYNQWVQKSYKRERDASFNKKSNDFITNPGYLETRSFDDWHKQSRFDQIVGGYLMRGDPNIPTAKNWNADLPFGQRFKDELDRLENDLKGKPNIIPTQ